ncbi:HIT domain-containing protein [Candidatus Pacearchaeota archaeon]|nr:HIT domain-containing protein [Candidatus Pacearchaeota archaeon]
MVLSDSQVVEVKKQLMEQIKNFPDDKRIEAEGQIETMDAAQLEEFLKANNLVKDEANSSCPFCSIVSGLIPSTKIGENDSAVAVLEINPISKGHSLIIPKDHIETPDKLPKDLQDLVKDVSEKLKKKFSPKDIIVKSVNMFGHEIVNLLPVYNNETMESEKSQATPEDLNKLRDELDSVPEVIEEVKPEKISSDEPGPEKISSDDMWLPVRIP